MGGTLAQPFVHETIRSSALMAGLTPKNMAAAKKAAPAGSYDIFWAVGISGARKVISWILQESIQEPTRDANDGDVAWKVAAGRR